MIGTRLPVDRVAAGIAELVAPALAATDDAARGRGRGAPHHRLADEDRDDDA